ncbi:MAG: ankyrin repeat domain-containing protein [Candidatus Sericytochromatia bacterium]
MGSARLLPWFRPALVLGLLVWSCLPSLAAPARVDRPEVLVRAVLSGHGAAVETFLAQYVTDLDAPLPLSAQQQLRPLSLTLISWRGAVQDQVLQRSFPQRYRPETPVALAERLLRLGASAVYQEPDWAERTPLHLVFELPEAEQVGMLNLLLKYHADPNLGRLDREGLTPVAWGKQRNPALGTWLERYRPSGLSDFIPRYAPFAYAAGTSALETFARQEALVTALQRGEIAAAKTLLEAELSPDFYLMYPIGRPLIVEQVLQGRTEALALLLDHEADLRLSDLQGRSALHAAASRPETLLLERLLRAQAPLEARDQQGETPLFWALRAGRSENVKLLLAAGARRDARNLAGQTPLTLLESLENPTPELRTLLASP